MRPQHVVTETYEHYQYRHRNDNSNGLIFAGIFGIFLSLACSVAGFQFFLFGLMISIGLIYLGKKIRKR